jgi:hypothetical protein
MTIIAHRRGDGRMIIRVARNQRETERAGARETAVAPGALCTVPGCARDDLTARGVCRVPNGNRAR